MEKLIVKNLSHRFGYEYTLYDISFELNENECISIIGPSGGGKSTLLRLCSGLEDVQEGSVKNSFYTQSVAFQDVRLFPWKNVVDNISLGLLNSSFTCKEKDGIAKQIALDFGLKVEDFNKYPKDLSGGMSSRVSLARVLANKPKLLFLDEPFSALDIGIKKELIESLKLYLKQNCAAMFFITHDISEAVKLSDKILLLKAEPGEIVYEFDIKTKKEERSEEFVLSYTQKLLMNETLIKTFTWELR
ncbi:MAG: ATP-binding cassette domain-containing protein [Campylobacteraceae bacterium]|jgi:NitT/TauT family transport system ATP-binding protein|nr:ATP-binding cassette domain-containing protein [Campylobacteraceae bacterium]